MSGVVAPPLPGLTTAPQAVKFRDTLNVVDRKLPQAVRIGPAQRKLPPERRRNLHAEDPTARLLEGNRWVCVCVGSC